VNARPTSFETTSSNDCIDMRVVKIAYAGPCVNFYEMRPVSGGRVPEFTAGAHVDLHLPNRLVRQYSIASDPEDRSRYVFGVKLDKSGRGGSRIVHEVCTAGAVIPVGPPRCTFSLVEDGKPAIFMSGGIGVTPFLSMLARAGRIGMDWRLHAAVRTREDILLLSSAAELGERVVTHVDEEHDGRPFDLAQIVRSAAPDTHLYCCGPSPMLDAFEQAASARNGQYNHVERFSSDTPAAMVGGYSVRLARSNRTIEVRPGQTLLAALQDSGVWVATSCEQGVCGSCETRILAGRADHRDLILTADEKSANQTMMICCSGSLDDVLVLDL
jgi:tetrachlorobenzoquinone reductase